MESTPIQWIEGRAGKLRVDDGGRGGLPVLFVHGNGGNRTQWAAQLEHLRKSRRAVAFDLPGMGESEPASSDDYSVESVAEDVGAVADALGIDRFVLVGHSYGGAVVGAYAAKHPDRVASLVFADATGDLRKMPAGELQRLRRGMAPESFQQFTEDWFTSMLFHATEKTKAAVIRSLRATSREVFVSAFNGLLTYDPKSSLQQYRGQCISIITGFPDSPYAIHRVVEGIPVRIMKGVSHWLMMDRPEEFNRLLEEFLADLK